MPTDIKLTSGPNGIDKLIFLNKILSDLELNVFLSERADFFLEFLDLFDRLSQVHFLAAADLDNEKKNTLWSRFSDPD